MSTDYFRLEKAAAPVERESLTRTALLLVFALTILAIISRRPDALTHAQFFGEDGRYWFADAYNLGALRALLVPHTGYFQTLPRLASAIALLVPLRYAPWVLNIIGIVIQALPVPLLLSSRFSRWGSLSARGLMAFVYVALPNSYELDASITEAQWHMGLVGAMVVLSAASPRILWRIFDMVCVLLCGLTGPFSPFLFPAALAVWWKRRTRWHLVLAALLALCGAVQLFSLLSSLDATRPRVPLGATANLFVRMLAGDVYLGAILGVNHYATRAAFVPLLLVAIVGTAVLSYALWRASLEFKIFIVFCFLIYLGSLRTPMMSFDKPQWPLMVDVPGVRYWFLPMIALLWSAVWCASSANWRPMRWLASATLVLSVVGIVRDWNNPPYASQNFGAYANRFESLAAGQAMTLPTYPPGWTMMLIKHGRSCPALPLGRMDEPAENTSVRQSVAVRGWVFATAPLRSVDLYIDGKKAASTMPNIPRPDVNQVYPGGAIHDKGWQSTLNISAVQPGPHQIEAHAALADGCEMIVGVATVQKTP